MKFVWDDINKAHIARHGIEPWFAEKIFREGQSCLKRSKILYRYVIEATIREKHYRLVFSVAPSGDEIYVVTAYEMKKRKS